MHATNIYKMTEDHATMDSEIEIYCAICGAGFIRVVDLEFHQSAHDVEFMTSGMNSLAELTDEHEREHGVNVHPLKSTDQKVRDQDVRAPKQTSQMTATIQTPHGSPTSAATGYKDTAIMPTSKAEALTLSPTSGPLRVCFFVCQRVCFKEPLPQAHDSRPGHSPDFCSISITLRYLPLIYTRAVAQS